MMIMMMIQTLTGCGFCSTQKWLASRHFHVCFDLLLSSEAVLWFGVDQCVSRDGDPCGLPSGLPWPFASFNFWSNGSASIIEWRKQRQRPMFYSSGSVRTDCKWFDDLSLIPWSLALRSMRSRILYLPLSSAAAPPRYRLKNMHCAEYCPYQQSPNPTNCHWNMKRLRYFNSSWVEFLSERVSVWTIAVQRFFVSIARVALDHEIRGHSIGSFLTQTLVLPHGSGISLMRCHVNEAPCSNLDYFLAGFAF